MKWLSNMRRANWDLQGQQFMMFRRIKFKLYSSQIFIHFQLEIEIVSCHIPMTHLYYHQTAGHMMTSSNGNIFRVFPAQRPVTRSFDVFFDLRLNKRLSKQSWGWWCETLSIHYDVILMQAKPLANTNITKSSRSGALLLTCVNFKP